MAVNRQRQKEVADSLEEICMYSKEYVRLLREGQGDEFAYAMLYYLRRQVGYLTRRLGTAVPPQDWTDKAIEVAASHVWNNSGR